MFSDFQSFYWLIYGDLVEVSLLILVIVSVIALLLIAIDRAFARFEERR